MLGSNAGVSNPASEVAQLDREKLALERAKLDYEQVKVLFDYTKFHIGVYTTLITIIVTGLYYLRITQGVNFKPNLLFIYGSMVMFGIAGLSGGIIASTLPHHSSIKEFWKERIGPFRLRIMSGEFWTYCEHTAFWLGVVSAVLSL
jgi:hypothetical protein